MNDLEGYAGRYTEQYAEGSFETVLVGIRRRHVLHWLRCYGARRVLEVGCGLEPLFSHYEGFEAWGVIEPIADFAERAREIASGDDRIQVWEGHLEERTEALAGRAFDFIVLSGLLHEVRDPLALLDVVRSLSTRETVLHVNVPNMFSFHRLLAVEMGLIADPCEISQMDRRFGHHGRFDNPRLAELLRRAGFEIVDHGTYFVKPFTHEQMDVLLRTGSFPPSVIDGLDRMTKYLPEHGCELYANARPS